MSDFCTKCAKEHFGEEVSPEIDVQKEFESLEPGMCSSGWICEGCGLTVIGKTDEGELKVIRIRSEEESLNYWEDY
jgi:hypothetical protein